MLRNITPRLAGLPSSVETSTPPPGARPTMSRVVQLTGDGAAMLAQLAAELRTSAVAIEGGEWFAIVASASKEAGRLTLRTKAQLARRIWQLTRTAAGRYGHRYAAYSLMSDLDVAVGIARSLPRRARKAARAFRGLPRERQIDELSKVVLGVLVFYAVAGGSDLEGGLPDLDWQFGAAAHRSVVSHSVFLGFGAEFSLRVATGVLRSTYARLPEPHHPFWDRLNSLIAQHEGVAIAAMWAAVGAHLLKDANWFADATKPYADLPVSLPMEVHQALFGFNGFAAEAIGLDALGRGSQKRS